MCQHRARSLTWREFCLQQKWFQFFFIFMISEKFPLYFYELCDDHNLEFEEY